LNLPEDHCIELIRALVNLALFATVIFERNYPESKASNKADHLQRALKSIDIGMRSWIDKDPIVGKKMFGGYIHTSRGSRKLGKGSLEIKVYFFIIVALLYIVLNMFL